MHDEVTNFLGFIFSFSISSAMADRKKERMREVLKFDYFESNKSFWWSKSIFHNF